MTRTAIKTRNDTEFLGAEIPRPLKKRIVDLAAETRLPIRYHVEQLLTEAFAARDEQAAVLGSDDKGRQVVQPTA